MNKQGAEAQTETENSYMEYDHAAHRARLHQLIGELYEGNVQLAADLRSSNHSEWETHAELAEANERIEELKLQVRDFDPNEWSIEGTVVKRLADEDGEGLPTWELTSLAEGKFLGWVRETEDGKWEWIDALRLFGKYPIWSDMADAVIAKMSSGAGPEAAR